MQITTFDIESNEVSNIEIPLRRLATSADAKEAAYWRKLVALVEHLHSQGNDHKLTGYVFSQGLDLWAPDPPDPAREQAMKQFADEWLQSNPDAEKRKLSREMLKGFPSKPRTKLTVWIDWLDWVPLQDYISQVHYRMQIQHPGKVLSEDVRAKTPEEVERVIRRTFRW
jgi:hypothetical protein